MELPFQVQKSSLWAIGSITISITSIMDAADKTIASEDEKYFKAISLETIDNKSQFTPISNGTPPTLYPKELP